MLTKTDILQIARNQLALDYNCMPSDLDKSKKYENTIVPNELIKGRQ
ncbi:hypothetical protein [Clostridium oryzae]|nr:hypothetical protein [Clostridium oryzae]